MDNNLHVDKQPSSTSPTPARAGQVGLMPGLVGAGVDLAGASVRTTLGLVGEVRGQTLAVATQSIDFAEQLVHGICDFGRRSARRIDQAIGDVLGVFERAALSTLGTVRATTDQAAHLAMTVAESAMGPARPDGKN